MDKLIFAVCSSGPYRHVGELLRKDRHAWFPWGYRWNQVSEDVIPQIVHGAEAELWEIDDVRAPFTATPLAVVGIDFVSRAADYVAMTLRSTDRRPVAPAAAVLQGSERGSLAFTIARPE